MGRHVGTRSAALLAALLVPACSYVFDLPASAQAIEEAFDAAPDVKPPETDADTREASVPFCASRTSPSIACIDFDDGAPLAGTLNVTPGGRLEIVSSVPLSPPRALLAVASEGQASVTRELGSLEGGVAVELALLVSAWPGNADATAIDVSQGDVRCRVALTGEDGQWSLTQACTSAGVETGRLATRSEKRIEPSRWHRFGLSIRFGAPTSIALAIDGVRTVDIAALEALPSGTVGVTFGIASVRKREETLAAPLIVFQDDVLVTTP
jgi:hypothetical protein